MKGMQLAERIGSIDERLIEEAGALPLPAVRRRMQALRRAAALAAVLALMVCSGAVGALAFGEEREVPAQQETVELAEIGLTLLLPESWAGRYTVEEGTFAPYGSPMWSFFAKRVHDAGTPEEDGGASVPQGLLFTVFQCADVSLSAEEFQQGSLAGIGRYLFATENATFALLCATDVQFDPEDPEQQAEWTALAQGIGEVRFILTPLSGGE